MKKVTLLSLITATVLFTACGEDTKKAASDMAASATQSAKEAVSNAADKVAEVKEEAEAKAVDAAQALKDRAATATEAVKETASNVVDSVKDAAVATTAAVGTAVADNAAGKAAFAKCSGCHGADGKTKALGKSAVIAGQSASDIETKLAAYKAGTRNVAGIGMLMKGQVAAMSDEDIKAVAAYISSL